jgi:hypothetical protein
MSQEFFYGFQTTSKMTLNALNVTQIWKSKGLITILKLQKPEESLIKRSKPPVHPINKLK